MAVALPQPRRLLDVPCLVCEDDASGNHYGANSCDECARFFARSIRGGHFHICINLRIGHCVIITRDAGRSCQACRLAKCFTVGMRRNAIPGIERRYLPPRRYDPNVQYIGGYYAAPLILEPPAYLNVNDMIDEPERQPMVNPYNIADNSLEEQTARAMSPHRVNRVLTDIERQAMGDAASNLLFIGVLWVKGITSFNRLYMGDQLILLDMAWKDIFIIGTLDYGFPVQLKTFLNINQLPFGRDVDRYLKLISEVTAIKPDDFELACLRCLALFRAFSGDIQNTNFARFRDVPAIMVLQEHSTYLFNVYTRGTYPEQPYRLYRLLQLIPLICAVPKELIMFLFLRNLPQDSVEQYIEMCVYNDEVYNLFPAPGNEV